MDYRRLKKAVKNNNINQVRRLLNYGCRVTKLKNIDWLCFNVIDEVSSIEILRLILENLESGCINNYGIQYKFTLITRAIFQCKSIEIVKEILSNGGDINCVDGFDMTPFIQVVRHNGSNVDYAEQLILMGADINKFTPKYHFTPMHFCKKVEMFNLLVKYNAEINTRNVFGRTPLMSALQCDTDIELIYGLINKGADIHETDVNGNGTLHYSNSAEFVGVLIHHGVSVNCINNKGQTPLLLAVISYKDSEFIEILLKNGADPNRLDFELNSPLFAARSPEIINLLIQNGGKVLIKSEINSVPLNKIIEVMNTSLPENLSHIIKLTLLIDQCEVYENLPDSNFYTDFAEKCKNELIEMKTVKIIDEINLHNLCIFTITKFRLCFDRLASECLKNLSNIENLIKLRFPIYSDVILLKFEEIKVEKHKRDLIKKLDGVIIVSNSDFYLDNKECNTCGINDLNMSTELCEISEGIELHYDCLYVVASYLNYKQISDLFIASL
ncbi:uncharacterized protein LOC142319385 [Lycorma delicatula]|uniref:uncharacterized protein LOC142319385 n=1 Tax=Lycorma delicatula TaxID=130591 RepID=UPI003F50F1B5